MNQAIVRAIDGPAKSAILTKATVRAAKNLGLTNRVLGKIIGVSESTASRLNAGDYRLTETAKAFETAALFIRLYRSLDSLVGGDDAIAKAWLDSNNVALGAKPIELIQTLSGLMDVIAYLDARRAIV